MQKFLRYFLIVILLWILTLPWTAHYLTKISDTYPTFMKRNNQLKQKTDLRNVDLVRLAVVSCGGEERMEETLTLIKSAIISAIKFQLPSLEIIIFADDESLYPFDIKLNKLSESIGNRGVKFHYEIHPLMFPPEEDEEEWRKLFRPCATQRLFLPSALPHINELIYLDTDVLILDDLRELWSFFLSMNSSQHTGLVPEHESHAVGWYNRFATHPYVPPLGVNSGVMLMNLTRLREFHWEEKAIKYYKEYKKQLVFGDQDIINIIFHFYPESLYILPCAFNFRPDHCIYGIDKGCRSAKDLSIKLIHGNRQVFHEPSKLPAFHLIYSFFNKLNLSKEEGFIQAGFEELKRQLNRLNSKGTGGCDQISEIILNKESNL